MSLSRWQPLQEALALRSAMDRLFDETFFQPLGRTAENSLALDVIDQGQALVVKASVPGYTPEQIDVSIHGDTLTIRGEMQTEEETEHERYHLRERSVGSFQRTLRLPVGVDSSQATAAYQHGVLTLHLPKVAEQTAQKITVQSK